MAVRTSYSDVFLVLLLESALFLEEREALVFLLVVIVADLAVAAVNSRLRTRAQMSTYALELKLLAALAGDYTVRAVAKVVQSLLVRHDASILPVLLIK